MHTLRPIAHAAAIACAGLIALSPAVQAQTDASAGNGATSTLPRVDITGARERYRAETTSAGTRSPTPTEQIPQSIVTLNRNLLQDQGSTTLSDALRNASNVNAVDSRDAWNSNFKVRGFNASTVVDGVAMPGYFAGFESLSAADRIDVVKGPAGALYGATQGQGGTTSTGGTIALSTRAADPLRTVREVGLRVGSFDTRAFNLDLNQPLAEDWAVRLVGDVGQTGFETEGLTQRHRAWAPSVTWQPDGRTQVVLRLRSQDTKGQDYSGLPRTGTLDTTQLTLARDHLIVSQGQPDNTLMSRGANLQWTEQINEVWSGQLLLSRQSAEIDQRGVWLGDPLVCGFGAATLTGNYVCGARLWDRFTTTTVSPALTARYRSGAVQHTAQVGLDWEKTRDEAFMAFPNGLGPLDFFAFANLPSTSYQTWVEPVAPDPADQRNTYRSRTVYLQDQVDVGAWHVLGSLRHTDIQVTDVNANAFFGHDNVTRNRTLTPRAGVVRDWTTQVSTFASLSKGVKVPIGSVFSTPPKPETSLQKEIGLRLKDLGGLSGSLAWFDLARENVAVGDPANPGKSRQTGLQRSRGIEADLRWQASPALTWLAQATRMKARIEEDTTAANVGKVLFNVPERSARIAARHDWLQGPAAGLSAGLGLTHHGRLAGDTTNTYFTPAATLWDAQLGYRMGDARYALRIDNLADKKYFVPSTYFGGGQVIPARPRTVQASATFAF
ncbi:TonB-dependent siderophore receptor [Sphaerotilus mobilis]|nr:TonB-dependent siderophore receptor [Sphaerotilus mobilis]